VLSQGGGQMPAPPPPLSRGHRAEGTGCHRTHQYMRWCALGRLLLLGVWLPTRCGSQSQFARIAAQTQPWPLIECAGQWLDHTSPLVVPSGTAWGPENHFDGVHSFGGGANDFASCLQQCMHRAGCHMFHYVRQGLDPKCGVPSTGLPGTFVPAPAFIPDNNVGIYTLGTCGCPGCCIGIEEPPNGAWGTCRIDGTLPLNNSCNLRCDPGHEIGANGTLHMACREPGATLRTGGSARVNCTACPVGKFSTDGSACRVCSQPAPHVSTQQHEEFAQYACRAHRDTVLRNCTPPCPVAFGETAPCVAGGALTPGSDRQCAQCLTQVSWSNTTSGPCVPCTVCPRGWEADVRCYPWRDGSCRRCAAGRYSPVADVPGQPPTSRCLACTVCAPGFGEVVRCNSTTNGICGPCWFAQAENTCSPAVEDCSRSTWSTGGFVGSTCEMCHPCVPGQEQVGNCTLHHDTQCRTCGHEEYELHGKCMPCTAPCAPEYQEFTPCTNRTNRVCSQCPAGQFSLGSSSSTTVTQASAVSSSSSASTTATVTTSVSASTHAVCVLWTTCAAHEYEAAPPSLARDRWCMPFACAPACDAHATCLPRDINGSAHQAVCVCNVEFWGTGVTCMPVTSCAAGLTFEHLPPTETTDRVCVDATVCSAGEYEKVPATETADRVCAACTAGTYQPLLGRTVCPTCANGTYDHDQDPTTQCSVCPTQQGFFVSPDSTQCFAAAVVALVLDLDIGTIPTGTAARRIFENDLTVAIANRLMINSTRVVLLGVDAGSVIVHVEILPDPLGTRGPSVAVLGGMSSLGSFSVLSVTPVDDPCVVQPCDAQATCSRLTFGNYRCSCLSPSFWGTGHACLPTTQCVTGFTFEQIAPSPTSDRLCGTVRSCTGSEIETTVPTPMIDRVCTPCPPGMMVTSGRCIPCGNTTYDHDATSSTPCASCPPGRHSNPFSRTAMMVNGTWVNGSQVCIVEDACVARTDNCAAQASCRRTGFGTYSCECSHGHWGAGDWCVPWTVCTAALSFETVPPTALRDRTCVAVRHCLAHEYEARPPTLLLDRVCFVCPAGSTVSIAGEVCEACPSGKYDHDSTSATACQLCPAGSVVGALRRSCVLQNPCVQRTTHNCHVKATCIHTGTGAFSCTCTHGFWGQGSWCVPWTNCIQNATWAPTAPNSTANRRCKSVTHCRRDEYETRAPSLIKDRECTLCPPGHEVLKYGYSCTACLSGYYDHDQTSSTPCRRCSVGHTVAADRTACGLADPCAASELNGCHVQAKCNNTAVGEYSCECLPGFYGSGWWCMPWTECHVGSTYSVREPTYATDRVCAAITICNVGEFQTVAPQCFEYSLSDSSSGSWAMSGLSTTATAPRTKGCAGLATDRQCARCLPGTFQPLQSHAPPSDEDWQADPRLACPRCALSTFDHDSNPETICMECPVGHFVNKNSTACTLYDSCAGSAFNDCHEAALCSWTGPGVHFCECMDGFYGDGVVCSVWSTCLPFAAFETQAPNSTVDRLCQMATPCPAGEREVAAAVGTIDRRCEPCGVGTYSAPSELICHECTGLYIDHDDDPATPCQANVGVIVAAILLLSMAGLIAAAVMPLYFSRRLMCLSRVAPEDAYTLPVEPEKAAAEGQEGEEAQASAVMDSLDLNRRNSEASSSSSSYSSSPSIVVGDSAAIDEQLVQARASLEADMDDDI
jgi:hypothetical protein